MESHKIPWFQSPPNHQPLSIGSSSGFERQVELFEVITRWSENSKKPFVVAGTHGTRPGKPTKNYGKIHHFSWENPLFQW